MDSTVAEATYVAMPTEYIPKFTATLATHHSFQLRQAMHCSQEMAEAITLRQIQELHQHEQASSHQYLVAVQWQNTIIGGAWYSAPPQQVAILQWLMIEEDFQGQGHGKNLLAHVVGQCRCAGSAGLALHVFTANHKSIHLYESMGFSDVGKEMYLKW